MLGAIPPNTGYSFAVTKPKVPYLADTDIAAQADRLRADYYAARGTDLTPRFPIRSLVLEYLKTRDHLETDLDADLGTNDQGDKIAGLLAASATGGAIKIDYAIAAGPMLPFTLAHEVGHWILHAPILRRQFVEDHSAGASSGAAGNRADEVPGARMSERARTAALSHSGAELVTLRRDLAGTRGDSLEWQANRFAVHLLMPASLVCAEFRKRYGTVNRLHADQPPAFLGRWPKRREYSKFMATRGQSSSMAPLTEDFGVSVESMAIRLEELELV
jgi:hypothetical protein